VEVEAEVIVEVKVEMKTEVNHWYPDGFLMIFLILGIFLVNLHRNNYFI